MRLFICEFITGGGLQDKALSENLIREGNMMFHTLLKDLLDAGITDIVTTRDQRLEPIRLPIDLISINDEIYKIWQACMKDADAVWIIAPESDDILLNLTLMAERSDCFILGCNSKSVKSASSKLLTTNLLQKNNIPCIETISLKNAIIPESKNGWVIKPDDGIGGENVYFCANREEIETLKASINTEQFIIQNFLTGISTSLSMICYQGETRLLACNEQLFSFKQGKGKLSGLIVNGLLGQWSLFESIARQIAKADKDLSGYVGIDLIMTESGPIVIEINPRLTTSYVGLRQSLSLNPAELILSIWQNGFIPEINRKLFVPVKLLFGKTNVV